MQSIHPVQVVAVTSGKGGVGKSTVAVNLALALNDLGRRVMLFDAALEMANVDLLLGLTVERTLADVLVGRCELKDVLLVGPGGVRIVPSALGVQGIRRFTVGEYAGLIQAFSDIGEDVDVLVVDTASGLGEDMVCFARAAQEVLVVLCDEPTSIMDAYELIKLLGRDYGVSRFRVLANMVAGPQEGRNLFARLVGLTDHFLAVTLQYAGAVPYDESLRKAVQKQRAVYEAFPRAKSAQAFRALAARIDEWPLPANPRGHLEFFVERLIRSTRAAAAG